MPLIATHNEKTIERLLKRECSQVTSHAETFSSHRTEYSAVMRWLIRAFLTESGDCTAETSLSDAGALRRELPLCVVESDVNGDIID